MCGINLLIWDSSPEADQRFAKIMEQHLYATVNHRGPDSSTAMIVERDRQSIGIIFHRLAIVGGAAGAQPFVNETDKYVLVCNGEIYNYRELIRDHDLTPSTTSDCEVIGLLFMKYNKDIQHVITLLNGDYAFCLVDTSEDYYTCYAGRDKFGVRPLYYTYDMFDRWMSFSSEMKGVLDYTSHEVFPVSINSCDIFFDYCHIKTVAAQQIPIPISDFYSQIVNLLTASVRRRLSTVTGDVGCLLAGLDSSLVTSLIRRIIVEDKLDIKMEAFTIGMEGVISSDVEAGKKTAAYLHVPHTILPFNPHQAIDEHLEHLIYHLETYDTTTIRAAMPMYLMCKYIKENRPNIKVLFSGEGSDELLGYLYFHYAPSFKHWKLETERLCRELEYFDVRRADRTTAAHGLELRVPFLDKDFTTFIMNADKCAEWFSEDFPDQIEGHTYIQTESGYRKDITKWPEKYHLRKAFEGDYLPHDILWRRKEALSNGISDNTEGKMTWIDYLQQHAMESLSEEGLTPLAYEELYYKTIFYRIFGREHPRMMPHYWRARWTEVKDPSATALSVYKSGPEEKK